MILSSQITLAERAAAMLWQAGRLLGLNQGGRLAICQYVALHPINGTLKCFSFSHSLRKEAPGRLPKEELVADLDLLSAPTPSASPAAGAYQVGEVSNAIHSLAQAQRDATHPHVTACSY